MAAWGGRADGAGGLGRGGPQTRGSSTGRPRSWLSESSPKHATEPDQYIELYEEIERLPEKYRNPIVLCYLQGHTQEQASQRLGWPLGTVQIRLHRGREQLRSRLTRRGVGPGGLVTTVLALPRKYRDGGFRYGPAGLGQRRPQRRGPVCRGEDDGRARLAVCRDAG